MTGNVRPETMERWTAIIRAVNTPKPIGTIEFE